MDAAKPSAWLPERTPTWTDVVTGAVAVVLSATYLVSLETILWRWVALGFACFAVAAGPVAASRVGEWTGRWFRSVDAAGRAAAIFGYAVVVWIVLGSVEVPTTPVLGFASGALLAIFVLVVGHVVRSGEVQGLRST